MVFWVVFAAFLAVRPSAEVELVASLPNVENPPPMNRKILLVQPPKLCQIVGPTKAGGMIDVGGCLVGVGVVVVGGWTCSGSWVGCCVVVVGVVDGVELLGLEVGVVDDVLVGFVATLLLDEGVEVEEDVVLAGVCITTLPLGEKADSCSKTSLALTLKYQVVSDNTVLCVNVFVVDEALLAQPPATVSQQTV